MNTADILDKAADLIEQRGWTQEQYVDNDGCVCLSGAAYVALGIEPVPNRSAVSWPTFTDDLDYAHDDVLFWLNNWLKAQGLSEYGVVAYNDAPGRTREEVVSTLRAAAQAARAEQ